MLVKPGVLQGTSSLHILRCRWRKRKKDRHSGRSPGQTVE